MAIAHLFFYVSIAVLFYCYAGYGILLFFINAFTNLFAKKSTEKTTDELPHVTLIVAAYNEELILEQKVINTLALDYPVEKLSIIFITDGSTDDSGSIIRRFPGVTLLHEDERKGKYAAIKRAMKEVRTPVVVFSDANTILNSDCINKIVGHYKNPVIGGVAGEKKILVNPEVGAVGQVEGIYWQYESLLKRLDAGFYTVVGAAGELFSIRTCLFKEMDDQVILDDFVISMQICLQGYRIAYEPGAYATETASSSLKEEEKRKIRISAGAYQSVGYLKSCLNIFKYPLLSFQYISRRVLRWFFCPVSLVVLFVLNSKLVYDQPEVLLFTVLLYAQCFFYLLAFTGWLFLRKGKRAGLLAIPFYFVFMNYCLAKGFIRFLKKKQTVLWEKSVRQRL